MTPPRPQVDERARKREELIACHDLFDTPAGREALQRGYATDPAIVIAPTTSRFDPERLRVTPPVSVWREHFHGERHRKAVAYALRQWREIERRGIPELYGEIPDEDKLGYRIAAKAAELLVSRATGLPLALDLEADARDGDVPPYGVRHTKHLDGALLITKRDTPSRVYINVRGAYPLLEAKGWAYAHEAQHDRYWMAKDGRRYAYFLHALRPMSTLPPPNRS